MPTLYSPNDIHNITLSQTSNTMTQSGGSFAPLFGEKWEIDGPISLCTWKFSTLAVLWMQKKLCPLKLGPLLVFQVRPEFPIAFDSHLSLSTHLLYTCMIARSNELVGKTAAEAKCKLHIKKKPTKNLTYPPEP